MSCFYRMTGKLRQNLKDCVFWFHNKFRISVTMNEMSTWKHTFIIGQFFSLILAVNKRRIYLTVCFLDFWKKFIKLFPAWLLYIVELHLRLIIYSAINETWHSIVKSFPESGSKYSKKNCWTLKCCEMTSIWTWVSNGFISLAYQTAANWIIWFCVFGLLFCL